MKNFSKGWKIEFFQDILMKMYSVISLYIENKSNSFGNEILIPYQNQRIYHKG